MASMYEQVQAISPERGYHIVGLVYLGYGSNFEEVYRSLNIEIRGEDALLLSQAETEEDIAQMIANVYNELDIDEQEPHFLLLRLEDWNIVIEPIPTQYKVALWTSALSVSPTAEIDVLAEDAKAAAILAMKTLQTLNMGVVVVMSSEQQETFYDATWRGVDEETLHYSRTEGAKRFTEKPFIWKAGNNG